MYNRSLARLDEIRRELKLDCISELKDLNQNASLYILAVSDDALPQMISKLSMSIRQEAIVVHTSGSTSQEIFKGNFKRFGIFYPLQSFTDERIQDFKDIPILMQASDESSLDILVSVGQKISDRIVRTTDEERNKLHLPAVVVNNFTNHLFHLAYKYCEKYKLDFSLLMPLIKETANRLESSEDPSIYQTGPAIRGDRKTIKKHLSLLSEQRSLSEIYKLISKSIENNKP